MACLLMPCCCVGQGLLYMGADEGFRVSGGGLRAMTGVYHEGSLSFNHIYVAP